MLADRHRVEAARLARLRTAARLLTRAELTTRAAQEVVLQTAELWAVVL